MRTRTTLLSTALLAAAGALLSAGTAAAPPGAAPPDGRSVYLGGLLYGSHCAFCHGPQGLGGISGKSVVGARASSIQMGIDAFVPGMAFLQGALTPAQVQAVSDFLSAGPVSDQQRYSVACGSCHGPDGDKPNRAGEDVRGKSVGKIAEAIQDEEAMDFLTDLTPADLQQIAAYLSGP